MSVRISKRIEVFPPDSGSSWYVSIAEAKAITARNNGRFLNSRQLKLNTYESKRCIWAVKGPSALYSEGIGFGPKYGTLQLT